MKKLRVLYTFVICLFYMYQSSLAEEKAELASTVEEKNEQKSIASWVGSAAGELKKFEIYPGVKMNFRWCPPTGEKGFMMGSPEGVGDRDEAQHKVILKKGFWMAETECTQAQWQTVMGSNPSHFKNVGKDAPVEEVSWDDICGKEGTRGSESFLGKLDKAGKIPAGLVVGLPTEAQWEYACRAGTKTAFHTGDNLTTKQANHHGEECRGRTIAVGSLKTPNAWGFHDMHGNALECCSDKYIREYGGGATGPTRPANLRVFRGGGWCDFADSCRSAYRWKYPSSASDACTGFRLIIQGEVLAKEK